MIAQSLLKQIDRGREGKNHGYSMGLPKLESIIDGVTKATSTLLFSTTGSGKSCSGCSLCSTAANLKDIVNAKGS